jgi:regulator of cell morphogenesis and NO signaling
MPGSADVFERLCIDYCCRGKRTLGDACYEHGIAPLQVLSDLNAACVSASGYWCRRWDQSSMTELADHIEQTHHVVARDALDRLAVLAPRVAVAHADAHPELREVATLITLLRGDMLEHMIREERVLFPWLRRLERPMEITSGPPWSVRRPIDCMVHDHDDVGRLLAELHRLTVGYAPPVDACMSYRSLLDLLRALERDTHEHIHKENAILFPAGIRAEEYRKACVALPTPEVT